MSPRFRFVLLLLACFAASFGFAQSSQTIVPGATGWTVAFDTDTHLAYVADENANKVYETNGVSITRTFDTGHALWLAFNRLTGRVYASDTGGVTVIETITGATTRVGLSDSGEIVVNKARGEAYVMPRQTVGLIYVIDASNHVRS